METDSTPSQQPVPRQPQSGVPSRPMQPMGHRPMVDGFGPRRPMPAMGAAQQRPTSRPTPIPVGGGMRPVPRPASVPHPATPIPTAATSALPQSQQPRPFVTRPMPDASAAPKARTSAPASDDMPTPASTGDMPPASKARVPKEHNRTGHAGLVGLIVFIVLGALLLSPLIPGKVIQNFPLASSTFSTGNQSLDCIGTQGSLQNTTAYNSKSGSPLTYTDSTSTTQSATCNGQMQRAVVERTSEFSSLALVIDILTAIVAAVVVARVWRLIFGEKRHVPHRHEG